MAPHAEPRLLPERSRPNFMGEPPQYPHIRELAGVPSGTLEGHVRKRRTTYSTLTTTCLTMHMSKSCTWAVGGGSPGYYLAMLSLYTHAVEYTHAV